MCNNRTNTKLIVVKYILLSIDDVTFLGDIKETVHLQELKTKASTVHNNSDKGRHFQSIGV